MRFQNVVSIMILAPTLLAISVAEPWADPEKSIGERRSEAEHYLSQLEAIIESQIQELAAILKGQEIRQLRSDGESWKLTRDRTCHEAGLNDPNPLADVLCRLRAAEARYKKLEGRIVAECGSDPCLLEGLR